MRARTWAGSDVFNEFFRIRVKMHPLYKLRHVIWLFFKLTGTANASLLACVTQLCRLIIGVRILRNFVFSKFYSFRFLSSVIGHIFASVCEVQLRLCVILYDSKFHSLILSKIYRLSIFFPKTV